jgi:hypothetical protein
MRKVSSVQVKAKVRKKKLTRPKGVKLRGHHFTQLNSVIALEVDGLDWGLLHCSPYSFGETHRM